MSLKVFFHNYDSVQCTGRFVFFKYVVSGKVLEKEVNGLLKIAGHINKFDCLRGFRIKKHLKLIARLIHNEIKY